LNTFDLKNDFVMGGSSGMRLHQIQYTLGSQLSKQQTKIANAQLHSLKKSVHRQLKLG